MFSMNAEHLWAFLLLGGYERRRGMDKYRLRCRMGFYSNLIFHQCAAWPVSTTTKNSVWRLQKRSNFVITNFSF